MIWKILCLTLFSIIILLVFILFYMHGIVRRVVYLLEIWPGIGRTDNYWILNLQNGKRMSTFFEANHFSSIALLGYNDYTFLLFEELAESGLDIVCIEDKYSKGLTPIPELKMIGLNSFIANADEFDIVVDMCDVDKGINYSIYRDSIEGKIKCPVISIADLVRVLQY